MITMVAPRSERCIANRRVLDRPQGLSVLVLGGAAFLGCATLLGCTGPLPGGPAGETDPRYIGADAGTGCAHPEEGCACEPGQPPIDCYLEPIIDEGRTTCSRGTRYCRQGAWTGCESIERYELRGGAGIAALVTGPSECNACDPACAVSRDTPTDGDLPGHSTDIVYDPVGDGISIEPEDMPVTPPPVDTDGDGVPDVADQCVGPGALRAADGSCYGDTFFFHDLPYGGPAAIDPLDVSVQVRTADIYFLMDTTGSMGGEIANLRSSLTSGTFITGCSGGIIGAIRCTIPDAWFGVGYHDDYPVSPYGSSGDDVYRNLQDITSSVSAAQTAVNALGLHYGNDGPEGQSQALWAIATGGGLGPYLSPRTGCAGGTFGYPCFRSGTIPIVILFTDAPFHNGPEGNNYAFGSGSGLPTPTAVTGNYTQATARAVGDAATSWTGWSGSTCGAGNNYTAGCAANDTGDVVFRFDVSVRTPITITTEGSSFDTIVSLRNSAFGEVSCDDDAGPGTTSQIVYTLDPGTYYAVVTGYGSSCQTTWEYVCTGSWWWRTCSWVPQTTCGLACGSYRVTIGNPTAASTGYPVTWPQAVAALDGAGIRVITIHSGGTYGLTDAQELANATGSYSSTGSNYVYSIPSDGSGLGSEVVDAIVDLADFNAMDIGARAVDNPATAIDERGFVQAITAVGWGPGICTGISGGTTFIHCNPGTNVDFSIAFQNDIVMPTTVPQVFDFWIEVVGDGTFVLERIPVRIVVPANLPAYPPSGSYWRDYDSTLFCQGTERPDWNTLSWETVAMPTGTSIRWEIRASQTLAGLATATPTTFTTPPTTSPVDLGARLTSAGIGNYLPYVRVTAVLLSSADRLSTPTLRSFEVRYTCIPQE